MCVALSMHEMVTEWRKPVDSAFILAGLPAFSTLSAIANIIKEEALKGFSSFALARASVPSDADIHLEADIVSPAGTLPPKCIRPHQQQTPTSSCANTWSITSLGFAVSCVSCVVRACLAGKCRVIRMAFCSPDQWGSPVQRLANICVIRRPRSAPPRLGPIVCGGPTLKLLGFTPTPGTGTGPTTRPCSAA